MEERERQEIVRMLEDGADALRAAVDGIGNAEAALRPALGGWSVLDCLEHVVVTERALFAGVRNATPADGPQHNPVREAKIRDRTLDRSRIIAAPDIVVPAGRFGSVSDALAQFEQARVETLAWVEKFEGDPRSWLTTHPMVRGPVNCYEMFLMIAPHPQRHAEQIAVIRAMLASQSSIGFSSG
jgi:hypothetical protein